MSKDCGGPEEVMDEVMLAEVNQDAIPHEAVREQDLSGVAARAEIVQYLAEQK